MGAGSSCPSLPEVKEALAKDPGLVSRVKNDDFLLLQAVRDNKLEVVDYLLNEAGCSLIDHVTQKEDNFCVFEAALEGRPEILRCLLQHDPRTVTRLRTVWPYQRRPLSAASYKGHLECVQIILEHAGQKILELEDGDGRTALEVAVEWDQTLVVQYLLESGASVRKGKSRGSNSMIRDLLFKWDPFVRAAREGDLSKVQELFACGWKSLDTDSSGRHAFHMTSAGGHLNVLQWLVNNIPGWNHARNVEEADGNGMMPLHHAARAGHADIIRFLLTDPKVVSKCLNATSTRGNTPLHLAYAFGHTDAVTALQGAATSRNDAGQLPSQTTISAVVPLPPPLPPMLPSLPPPLSPTFALAKDVQRLANQVAHVHARLPPTPPRGASPSKGAAQLKHEPEESDADPLIEIAKLQAQLLAIQSQLEQPTNLSTPLPPHPPLDPAAVEFVPWVPNESSSLNFRDTYAEKSGESATPSRTRSASKSSKRRSSTNTRVRPDVPAPPVSRGLTPLRNRLDALETTTSKLQAENRTLTSTVEALALRLDDHGHTVATVEANLAAEARLRVKVAETHKDQVAEDDSTPSVHALKLLEEEVSVVKASLEQEIGVFKARLESGTQAVRSELGKDMDALKSDLASVKAAQIDETINAYWVLEDPLEQKVFCRFVALFSASVDALLGLQTGLLAAGKKSGPDLRTSSRKATDFGLSIAKVAVGLVPGGGFVAGALGFGLNMVTGFLRGSDKAQWSRAMGNLEGHWPVGEAARGKDVRRTAALLVSEWRASKLDEDDDMEAFVRGAVDSCLLRLMKEYPRTEKPAVLMASALKDRLGPGVDDSVLDIYTSEKERQGHPSGHVMAEIMAGGKQVTANKVQKNLNMVLHLKEQVEELKAALVKTTGAK